MNELSDTYEYCPRCEANLTLQKGYRNDLPYWICKGCGEMLINPEVEADSDIMWFCDGCGAVLNTQTGFNEECGEWTCAECGFVNKIAPDEVYESEDAYREDLRNPYKGLSDEELLELSRYEETGSVNGRGDIVLVRDRESGDPAVRKFLTTYDRSVYAYLSEHPVPNLPRILAIFESDNCLIVQEEYVEGKTVADLLEDGPLSEKEALRIAERLCAILNKIHDLPTPIVHRDIKPSNVMIGLDGEVYLLDLNVAKWYDPEKTEDTRYLGTRNYAAPEQAGFGFGASSAKTDVYALGMLLNVMLTGTFPREKTASGPVGDIILRCISLEAKDRCTAAELQAALSRIMDQGDGVPGPFRERENGKKRKH